MPEELFLLLRRQLRVPKPLQYVLFLLPISLSVDIVGIAHSFITNDIIGILDLNEEISGVLVRILIRMILNASSPERLLEVTGRRVPRINLEQFVVVLRFLG